MREETSISVSGTCTPPRDQKRQQRRDLLHLEEIEQTGAHRLHIPLTPHDHQAGDGIEDNRARPQIADGLVQCHQVGLQPAERRAGGMDMQQPLFHPGSQIQAERAHVAQQLVRRLLKRHEQTWFAAAAGGGRKVGRDRGLTGAGHAGDQDGAAAVIAPGEHRIQPRYAT